MRNKRKIVTSKRIHHIDSICCFFFIHKQVHGQRGGTVVKRANVQPGIRVDVVHQHPGQQSGRGDR